MSDKQNHKRWRINFRFGVLLRDNDECRTCGKQHVQLDAHHITDRHKMPNGGYVISNGIALCNECHLMAEKFHITEGKEWETDFHPNDLYERICSSFEKANNDSLSLK